MLTKNQLEFLRDTESLLQIGENFCDQYGLPVEIARSLFLSENDWLFFVQAAAIIEAALNQGLASNIKSLNRSAELDLINSLEHLPMIGKASKVSFSKAAKFLDRDTAKLIEVICEIRNFYAHNLSHFNVTIAEYIFKRKSKEKARYLRLFNFPSNVTFELLQDHGSEIRADISHRLMSHLLWLRVTS